MPGGGQSNPEMNEDEEGGGSSSPLSSVRKDTVSNIDNFDYTP
jgi:hypothetical protein